MVSKPVSILVAGSILTATVALLIGGAVAAEEHLAPLLAGENAARERGLTRGESVSLAIHARAIDAEGNHQPAADAHVLLSALRRDGHAEPVARGATNGEGVVVLEVRPGPYRVEVAYGNASGAKDVPVGRDTRVGVLFDAEGRAHFEGRPRQDIARHGETAFLNVRVTQATPDGRAPVSGVAVTVQEVRPSPNGPVAGEFKAEDRTDARGVAAFSLFKRGYEVTLRSPTGDASSHVLLRGDTTLLVHFDENGTANVRIENHGARPPRDGAGPRDHPPPARLGVIARDDAGHALPGATVVIHRIEMRDSGYAREPIARGVTDENGVFVRPLPPGAYHVSVGHGNLRGEGSIRLEGDSRLPIKLA